MRARGRCAQQRRTSCQSGCYRPLPGRDRTSLRLGLGKIIVGDVEARQCADPVGDDRFLVVAEQVAAAVARVKRRDRAGFDQRLEESLGVVALPKPSMIRETATPRLRAASSASRTSLPISSSAKM